MSQTPFESVFPAVRSDETRPFSHGLELLADNTEEDGAQANAATSNCSAEEPSTVHSRSRCAATATARAGLCRDPHHGAVMPPIHLSSNFTFEGLGQPRRYDYTRSGNPTRDLLAEALAEAEGGAGAVVTSTGMSAVHLALQLTRPGDRVLAPFDGYGGTHRLLDAMHRKGLAEVDFVDTTDLEAVDTSLRKGPRLVLLETPSNPLLRVTDLADVCRRVRTCPASRDALIAVDNTFLSPALQNPLDPDLGADLVIHSTTKYLNGHSDVVGGAVVARDAALVEELSWWANCLGITGAPFDSYLTLRGLRTLHVRMAAHLENAHRVVELLCRHEAVSKVFWPGLPDHPGHEIAARQQKGFGAMVSFELVDGPAGGEADPLDTIRSFVDGLEHFCLAESLGGVESLVAHPATMTHAAMDPEARRRAGIGDRLLRLSIGIEDADDLVADLQAALDRTLHREDRNDFVEVA
ncbi:MAG: cystathionine gamma-synthase [Thermoanaerobaculia bacterium]|nr:cystathionine gamma-synthase [Thermoanaerobaculia bacterium]